MMLTDLADAARKSGLKVVETNNWKIRGHGPMASVETIVAHHTAGPKTGNAPSLGVVMNGRVGLSGPLAHIVLARDGTVYIVAAGLCYHAGVVGQSRWGNAYSIGIEAEATGVDAWTPVQYQAYVALVAALADHYDLEVNDVLGHKEVAVDSHGRLGRKTDPNFNMADFRDAVSDRLDQMEDPMLDPAVKAQLDRIEKALADHQASNVKQFQKTRDLIKTMAIQLTGVRAIVDRISKKVAA